MKTILALFILGFGCLPASTQDGTVVIYRPSKVVGWALKPSVYVDGNQAARLENGRYFSLQLGPGKHNFESSMKKTSALEVNVKSNETLYLEMVILPGNWRGGGRLVPVEQADGKSAVVKLKPLDAKELAIQASGTALSPQPDTPPAISQTESRVDVGPPTQPASVIVRSTPPGADINVDGKFMGSTPSTIQLAPGDHEVSIIKEGLRSWQRTMTVSAGGNITIDATMEKP